MRIALHDHQQIAAFLSQDPGRYLYESGDLDPFFWPQTLWFGWQVDADLQAICLLYLGDQLPILLAMGNTQSQKKLLLSLAGVLPTRFYAHLAPGLEKRVAGWTASGGERFHRMVLNVAHFRQFHFSTDPYQVKTLGESDLEPVLGFYREAYPQNWFNPRMLATGQYLGLIQDKEILAIAGVHVFSPVYQIAALGNIAVGLAVRGKGLGQTITAALCAQLLKQVQHVGLNVSSHNLAAITCYQKLGFKVHLDYQEWQFTRPSSCLSG